jgi:adenylate cyclase
MADEGFKRKLTAILSADVEGYSRLMGEDEDATIRILTTYRELMSTLIRKHRGRVIDSPGDNLLAEFLSVVDAVRCAVEIQEELRVRNAELSESRQMKFRIGINLGDVVEEGERIYGDGVNITARVEGLAEAGGICISGTVYDSIKDKLSLSYEPLGEHTVKNIKEPVRVYRMRIGPETAAPVVREKKAEPRRWQKAALTAVAVLVVAAGAIWNFYFRPPPIEPASIEKMAFPLPEKPSIAVLPFDNISGESEQDYIADGITDNIITALSYIPQMFVIARNSSFTYKRKPVKVQQVSEELGVRYILEGSVLKSKNRVRITAQLIDALTGGHLWSERYDRDIEDIFDLLDEITQAVAVALQVKLTDGEQARLWYDSTSNFEAWGYAVKGMGIFYKYGKEAMAKSRELFGKALELDPKYAHAVTMQAWTHFTDARYGFSDSRKESFKRAVELAKKSVTLNDNQPAVHLLLQHIHLLQGKHDKAVEEGRKALALGPNDAEVHILFGEALYRSGIFEEAVKMCEKAMRLHPHMPIYYAGHMMSAYYWVGRYEESLAMAEQLIDQYRKIGYRGWGVWGYWGSARAKVRLGRENEAREDVAKLLKINPNYSLELDRRNTLYKSALIEQEHVYLRRAGVPEHPPLPLPDKPSIAVLPFDNLSADPEQEYFSDGMTDDLITDLSKISGLFVIARNSSFQYKAKAVDVKKVSRELGVRYVLEGSVRRAGDKIRINAQLIDATTGGHLWAERYDEQMDNIFSLQDKITQKIVEALALKLTAGEQKVVASKESDNVEAYDAFLKGWQHYRRFSPDDFLKAVSLFEKAIELDPNYWRVYAAIASTYYKSWLRGEAWFQPLDITINEAYRRADKYLEIAMNNPTPLAHQVATEWYIRRGEYERAIAEAKLAIARDSNDPNSHLAMAWASISVGRHREGADLVKKAMRLDPVQQPFYSYVLGVAYFHMEKFEKAATLCERTLKHNPEDYYPLWFLTAAYAHLGREQEAKVAFAKLRKKNPRWTYSIWLTWYFKYKDPADFKRIKDGLRKAGMK